MNSKNKNINELKTCVVVAHDVFAYIMFDENQAWNIS